MTWPGSPALICASVIVPARVIEMMVPRAGGTIGGPETGPGTGPMVPLHAPSPIESAAAASVTRKMRAVTAVPSSGARCR